MLTFLSVSCKLKYLGVMVHGYYGVDLMPSVPGFSNLVLQVVSFSENVHLKNGH